MDEYPTRWAFSEKEVLRALEFFVEHQGERPPFVYWHDDSRPTA
jgi:hypothetical protein